MALRLSEGLGITRADAVFSAFVIVLIALAPERSLMHTYDSGRDWESFMKFVLELAAAGLLILHSPLARCDSYAFAGGRGMDLAFELRTEACPFTNVPNTRIIVATQHGERLVGCWNMEGAKTVAGAWRNGEQFRFDFSNFEVQSRYKGVPLRSISNKSDHNDQPISLYEERGSNLQGQTGKPEIPSWCSYATRPLETLVCGDEDLLTGDARIWKLWLEYKVRSGLTSEQLAKEWRRYIGQLDACKVERECVFMVQRERIAQYVAFLNKSRK